MVLYKGRVNAVMSREEMTEKNVMYYSTGANVEGAKMLKSLKKNKLQKEFFQNGCGKNTALFFP